MGTETSIIETGVDRLVELVNSRGKISAEEVEKELSVSHTVIMEWADFLEEESIISIEYKFTKPFLVSRKLGKKDVQEKIIEFSGKKEVFIRKAEGSLSFLGKEATKLNIIKEEFDKIKKDLGFDISSVKNELLDLEKYEKLKIDLDKQIENQKRASMDKIEVMSRQILRDKKEYENILSGVTKEETELKKEKEEVKTLEESEKLIRSRVNDLKEMLKNVESRASEGEEGIKLSEKNIQRLTIMAQAMRNRVLKEKEIIDPLVTKSEEQTKKIKELQDIVIKKIGEREKKLKNAEEVSIRIRNFFKRKMGIIELIEKINKDRNDLQKDLVDLIRKAKSFQLSSKSADIGSQITDIEKKFKDVETKKKIFGTELKKLSSFFK